MLPWKCCKALSLLVDLSHEKLHGSRHIDHKLELFHGVFLGYQGRYLMWDEDENWSFGVVMAQTLPPARSCCHVLEVVGS